MPLLPIDLSAAPRRIDLSPPAKSPSRRKPRCAFITYFQTLQKLPHFVLSSNGMISNCVMTHLHHPSVRRRSGRGSFLRRTTRGRHIALDDATSNDGADRAPVFARRRKRIRFRSRQDLVTQRPIKQKETRKRYSLTLKLKSTPASPFRFSVELRK